MGRKWIINYIRKENMIDYTALKKSSKQELEKELKTIRSYIEGDNACFGSADLKREQLLITELEKRDNETRH